MNSTSSLREPKGTLLFKKLSKKSAAAELQDLPCVVVAAAA